MEKLTIVITTYNRKVALIKMLKSIEIQGKIDQYDLIISDNHSDYDVKQWVKDNVSQTFFGNIEFIIRPYNIGGDLNIAFSFQQCKTKWMWLLSDDDTVTVDSISTILRDIEKYKNDVTLKYSIKGYERNLDTTANTFDGFLDYYLNNKHSAGEMIFMCNNVFNIEALNSYLEYAFMAADTYMSQLVPMFYSLINDNGVVRFCPEYIVEYGLSGKASYNLGKANIGFSNIIMFLDLNKEQSNKIRILFRPKRQYDLLVIFQNQKNSYMKRYMYRKYFNEYLSFFNLIDVLYFIFYYSCNFLHIRIEWFRELYHKIKK